MEVAERLHAVHSCGYVHCNVKPANVLWLPSQCQWRLVDFNLCTRTGEDVHVSAEVDYAAPEVVVSCTNESCIMASESMDSWSFGMIAFEILTGKRPFDVFHPGSEEVCLQKFNYSPVRPLLTETFILPNSVGLQNF